MGLIIYFYHLSMDIEYSLKSNLLKVMPILLFVIFVGSVPYHGIEALWRLSLSGNRAQVERAKT